MKIIWDCQLIQATFNYFLSNCYILMTKYSGGPNSIAKSENHLDSNVHHFLRNWDIGTIFAALNRITPLVLGHVISYVSKKIFFWVMSMPQLTVPLYRLLYRSLYRPPYRPLCPPSPGTSVRGRTTRPPWCCCCPAARASTPATSPGRRPWTRLRRAQTCSCSCSSTQRCSRSYSRTGTSGCSLGTQLLAVLCLL